MVKYNCDDTHLHTDKIKNTERSKHNRYFLQNTRINCKIYFRISSFDGFACNVSL